MELNWREREKKASNEREKNASQAGFSENCTINMTHLPKRGWREVESQIEFYNII